MMPPIDPTAKKFFIFTSLLVALIFFVVVFQYNPRDPISAVPQEEQVGVLVESTKYKEYNAQIHSKLLSKLKAELNNPSANDLYGERYMYNVKKEIKRLEVIRGGTTNNGNIPIKEEKYCIKYAQKGIEITVSTKEFDENYSHTKIDEMVEKCKKDCPACDFIGLKDDFWPEGYNKKVIGYFSFSISRNEKRDLKELLEFHQVAKRDIAVVEDSLAKKYKTKILNRDEGYYQVYWHKQ